MASYRHIRLLDNARIWLDVTEDDGQRLYLKAPLSQQITREGFWLELDGVGLVRFAFVAFMKKQAVFVAREVCHQPYPLSMQFPSQEAAWSESGETA